MKDKEANEYELHSKIGELRYLVEKQKEDYKKEIEKVHHDYSVTIKNMKKLAESVSMEGKARYHSKNMFWAYKILKCLFTSKFFIL